MSDPAWANLCNRHAGRPVLVCGSGPSLDAVDWDAMHDVPRIYINAVAFHCPIEPGITYWSVYDDVWDHTDCPWSELLEQVRAGNGMTAILPDYRSIDRGWHPSPPGPNVARWHVKRSAPYERRTREAMASDSRLYATGGSAMVCVQMAYYLGASELILAGMDGDDGRAERCAASYAHVAPTIYKTHRNRMLEAVRMIGLPVTDLAQEVPA